MNFTSLYRFIIEGCGILNVNKQKLDKSSFTILFNFKKNPGMFKIINLCRSTKVFLVPRLAFKLSHFTKVFIKLFTF